MLWPERCDNPNQNKSTNPIETAFLYVNKQQRTSRINSHNPKKMKPKDSATNDCRTKKIIEYRNKQKVKIVNKLLNDTNQ